MTNYDKFRKVFDGRFWNTLKQSLVPYKKDEEPGNKENFLKKLYEDIINCNYSPSIPRGYIVYNKHRRIVRIVPTFSYRDNCTYFFCIKNLEADIAINRVEGTYGATKWRI
jgi:hypothetical protein